MTFKCKSGYEDDDGSKKQNEKVKDDRLFPRGKRIKEEKMMSIVWYNSAKAQRKTRGESKITGRCLIAI